MPSASSADLLLPTHRIKSSRAAVTGLRWALSMSSEHSRIINKMQNLKRENKNTKCWECWRWIFRREKPWLTMGYSFY
jgi:hypothetical protein